MNSSTVKASPLLMEEIPQTHGQLVSCIGKLFHCMVGPPRAYFHIPLATGRDPERLAYTTLCWRTDGARTRQTEAALVMAMLEPFIDARRQLLERMGDDTAVLFWRRHISIEEETDQERQATTTRIYCRVVIPGADLSQYAHAEGALIKRL